MKAPRFNFQSCPTLKDYWVEIPVLIRAHLEHIGGHTGSVFNPGVVDHPQMRMQAPRHNLDKPSTSIGLNTRMQTMMCSRGGPLTPDAHLSLPMKAKLQIRRITSMVTVLWRLHFGTDEALSFITCMCRAIQQVLREISFAKQHIKWQRSRVFFFSNQALDSAIILH